MKPSWTPTPQTRPLPHQGAITAGFLYAVIVTALCALGGCLTYLLSACAGVLVVGLLFLAAWALCRSSGRRLAAHDPHHPTDRSPTQ